MVPTDLTCRTMAAGRWPVDNAGSYDEYYDEYSQGTALR